MGSFTSRQEVENAGELQQERIKNYKFPPRSGNFFGSHFIMGGERFDTSQPESYLFGENCDLNFLNRPTAFPYPPPQANEPTKTLKSLVNIRKESVRFVKVVGEKVILPSIRQSSTEQVDGNILRTLTSGGGGGDSQTTTNLYNIEFTFDSDAKCAITVYYFCSEEVSPSGVRLCSSTKSETYHYEKGINQYFSQPGHIFNPQLVPEDDLVYCPTKEQYPVAIHCVVEEGNEDCRQSHTTICVIDHHDNNYSLRALKQKIFVDGLSMLLLEIYGIENKAINKSSIDEEVDDHGSECVICMSETRDTLILPCRHLCLCNSCADSLRYQANNCPICRAPFRALLQIRAVQKGISTHSVIHQSSSANEPTSCDPSCPPGYVPVSLIEALNGPPQYVGRNSRHTEDDGDCLTSISLADNHKNISPHKPTNQRRSKGKKHVSTSTTAGVEINTDVVHTDHHDCNVIVANTDEKSPRPDKHDKIAVSYVPQDNLRIVNERHSFKLSKNNRHSTDTTNNSANLSQNEGDEDDSDTEGDTLLSPGSKYIPIQQAMPMTKIGIETDIVDDEENEDATNITRPSTTSSTISSLKNKKYKNSDKKRNSQEKESSAYKSTEVVIEDTLNSTRNSRSLKNNMAKKNLQKKSTSVGNIVGPTSGNIELKVNVSSLPDMLDSNSTSTRSSSDSYSSSSSTKQLLSSNPTAAAVAANIIVDGDKTALQNAVNV